jgi:transglutaminase-like putative cysteine protease
MNRTFKLLVVALSFVVFVCSAPRGAFAQDAGEVLYEDWSIVNMAGGDVGYVHTKSERVGTADAPLVRTALESRMRISRLGSEVVIESDQTYIEDASGQPLSIESRMLMSSQETLTNVRFEGGKAFVTTTVLGQARESSKDVSADLLGMYALGEATKARLDDVGATFDLATWSADLNDVTKVGITILGPEEVTVDGAVRTLRRYDSKMAAMGNTVTSSWVDENGDVVRASTKVMGIKMEIRRTTPELARAAYESNQMLAADVFNATLLTADDYLPTPRAADRARARITPKSADLDLAELFDARQKLVAKGENGAIDVDLLRLVPPAGREGVRPLAAAPAGLEDCLAASSMIQCDAELIVNTAKRIVGDETNAWKAAQMIERWVESNLVDKNMDVAYASALEVCQNLSGDCTEHAVLVCALARASGIPSRTAMGLLYLGGIWGGHAWTEVWIDGEWYALDATIGAGSVDALHLTVARLVMAEGAPAADFANLASIMGEIDIDVLELEFDGRRVDLTAPIASVDGERYTNRGWSLTLVVPAGFELEPLVPEKRIDFALLEIEGKPDGGKRVQVEVEAYDTPANLDWSTYLGSEDEVLVEIVVDGRQARVYETKNARARRRVAVQAGDALFVFDFSTVAGEANAAFAQALMASVDFDVASN